MSSHPIIDVLNSKFNGKISKGSHIEGEGSACVLEVVSIAKGVSFTDSPIKTGMPDFRAINDAFIDDEKRTISLVRLGVEFWDFSEWKTETKFKFSEILAIKTVSVILAKCLKGKRCDKVAIECESVVTLEEAKNAADAARYARYAGNAADATACAASARYAATYAADAARYAGNAADATAYAATYAAYAARYAANAATKDEFLIMCVGVWIEASQEARKSTGC